MRTSTATSPTHVEGRRMVDRLGQLNAAIATLEAEAKQLKEQIKCALIETGEERAEGDLFAVTLSITERCTLDTAKLSAAFPKAQYPDFYKSSIVETLRVSSR